MILAQFFHDRRLTRIIAAFMESASRKFRGKCAMLRAYEEAIRERYRFQHGDCMLILQATSSASS
jgi:S-adenosylmethionine:tRNA-ribosyltransferase-isomerase (queuine synthetase)